MADKVLRLPPSTLKVRAVVEVSQIGMQTWPSATSTCLACLARAAHSTFDWATSCAELEESERIRPAVCQKLHP